jgi:hypothetical protein
MTSLASLGIKLSSLSARMFGSDRERMANTASVAGRFFASISTNSATESPRQQATKNLVNLLTFDSNPFVLSESEFVINGNEGLVGEERGRGGKGKGRKGEGEERGWEEDRNEERKEQVTDIKSRVSYFP